MSHALDHATVLTVFGNEFLQARRSNRTWQHPTLSLGEHVRFVIADESSKDSFTSASDWFSKLHDLGAEGLKLYRGRELVVRIPDRKYSVLANAGRGRWYIEVDREGGSNLYGDIWSFVETEGGTGHWTVDYAQTKLLSLNPLQTDLRGIRDELGLILKEISEYAAGNQLDRFIPSFKQGIAALHSENPETLVVYVGFQADVGNCDVLNLQARQLIAAGRAGLSVFGGMGAWNDSPSNQITERYVELTDRLNDTSMRAIEAAANSTFLSART